MKYTELLTMILEKANTIKQECMAEELCASHIAVAVADFCSTQYTGFAVSDRTFWPSRFEEERLRYLFGKVIGVKSYFRLRLSQNGRKGVTEEAFQMHDCEHIAQLRNAEILSADVVFLCALTRLHQSYKPVVRGVDSDEAVMAHLQDADANIYDYVIEQIETVRTTLQKKAREAAAIRDWKPASKFAEPEQVLELVFENMQARHSGRMTTIKIPKFFGNRNLTLSVHCVDEIYYIHDHGCALRHLAQRLQDTQKYERVVKKVCHSHRIEKGRITGSFVNVSGFMYYLKDLIFVAQAELYYTRVNKQLCFKDKGYVYISEEKAEPFDGERLIHMLRESVSAYYDEKKGLHCWLQASNSPFPTRYIFLVESLEEGQLRFSDSLKGNYEGELLEPCYTCHEDEDLSVYRNFFSKLAKAFGGEFDGKNFYLMAKTKDFQGALFRFYQLAVLISRMGQEITLPKKTC